MSMEILCLFPHALHCASLLTELFAYFLYNKCIKSKLNVSLSSQSLSRKLFELTVEIVAILIYSSLVRSIGDKLEFVIDIRSRRGEESRLLWFTLLTCGIWYCLKSVRVRIELNYRTLNWCWITLFSHPWDNVPDIHNFSFLAHRIWGVQSMVTWLKGTTSW